MEVSGTFWEKKQVADTDEAHNYRGNLNVVPNFADPEKVSANKQIHSGLKHKLQTPNYHLLITRHYL